MTLNSFTQLCRDASSSKSHDGSSRLLSGKKKPEMEGKEEGKGDSEYEDEDDNEEEGRDDDGEEDSDVCGESFESSCIGDSDALEDWLTADESPCWPAYHRWRLSPRQLPTS